MGFTDSHIHLDALDLSPGGLGACMGETYQALIPGLTPEQTAKALETWAGVSKVSCAAGIHPWYLGDCPSPSNDPRMAALRQLCARPETMAVGETGLDYVAHRDAPTRRRAQAYFAAHIDLAMEFGKALVIHCVRAHNDCLGLLKRAGATKGIVHAFSGSEQERQAYEDLGFLIGIGSQVSNPNARRVRAAATQVHDDRLVCETDAPYQSPGFGKNAGVPSHIALVYAEVAALRGCTLERLQAMTRGNFTRVLKK